MSFSFCENTITDIISVGRALQTTNYFTALEEVEQQQSCPEVKSGLVS